MNSIKEKNEINQYKIIIGIGICAFGLVFFYEFINKAFFIAAIIGVIGVVFCTYFLQKQSQIDQKEKQNDRLLLYTDYLQNKEYCSLYDLTEIGGVTFEAVVHDLQCMMDHQWFDGGHIDRKNGMFYVSDKAFFENQSMAAENQKEDIPEGYLSELSDDTLVRLDEAEFLLAKILDKKAIIENKIIQDAIEKLNAEVLKIFKAVRSRNLQNDSIRRMMHYYLPMINEILENYIQTVSTRDKEEKIKLNKKVEQSLELSIQAFQSLYNDLGDDSAMEIEADTQVLRSLLENDGLLQKNKNQ